MPAYLDISKEEFVKGMRLLIRTTRPKKAEQAVLSFDGDVLHIEMAGASVGMPAKGTWPDQIRVSAKLLLNLAKVPPLTDPVRIMRDRNELRIDSLTMACEAQDSWKSQIQLPMNAGTAKILALEQQYTFEEIMAAGLGETLKDAQRSKSKGIQTALKALGPLGVNAEDLDLALQNALKRHQI